jgi:hypothetical protein
MAWFIDATSPAMTIKQTTRSASLALISSLAGFFAIAIFSSTATGVILHLRDFTVQSTTSSQAKPWPAPARWLGLIGEYGPDDDILIILEKDGKLCAC